jgi:MFS family permease
MSSTPSVPPAASAASSPLVGGWAGWYTVAVCMLLYVFSMIDRQVINLLVAPIQQQFGLGDFHMSLLMGPAFGLCYAFAAFPIAWLSDRISRRLVVFIGIMIWALAAMASGLARSFEELFVARMVVGVGEAALLPSAYVPISQLFQRERLATALSVLSMGSVGGMGLAYGLGGWFLEAAHGMSEWSGLAPWRLTFIISAIPCVPLALLMFTVPEHRPSTAALNAVDAPKVGAFLRRHGRVALAACAGFGLVSLCSSAIAAWLPTYLTRNFGWSTAQAGAVLGGIILLLASVAKIGSGVIVDRLFARGVADAHLRYLSVVSLVATPFVVAAFFMPVALPCLLLVSVYFLLPYSNMGYASAFVQLATPVLLRARTSALFLLVMNLLAMGLGPLLVGWLTESVIGDPQRLGWSLALVVAVTLPLAALALWWGMPAARALLGKADGSEEERR